VAAVTKTNRRTKALDMALRYTSEAEGEVLKYTSGAEGEVLKCTSEAAGEGSSDVVGGSERNACLKVVAGGFYTFFQSTTL
jgi:hypothetical protein